MCVCINVEDRFINIYWDEMCLGKGEMGGGSGEEKWKRPPTFRTRFPSVLLCLDNYIDDNKHARIVILWAPHPIHLFLSFSSLFPIPALSSFLSPTITRKFKCSARVLSVSLFIFSQKWKQFLFSDYSRIHGPVEQLKTSEEKIPSHFSISPFFSSEYSRFILGTFILTFNHHFTGPRYFPIKKT